MGLKDARDEGTRNMKPARLLGVCVLALLCSTHGLEAQGLSRDRDFDLGSVASVATVADVPSSEAKTIHQYAIVLYQTSSPTEQRTG
jgi:hypothetical protein